jgi:hypothetical protein
VIDVQSIQQHGVLAGDHVVVVVGGKVGVQAVGGLGGLAVADIVGQDQIKLRNVERLPWPEEHVGEHRVQQRRSIPAGAVEQQDRVGRVAGGVPFRCSQSQVMQLQRGQGLARSETEIGDGVIAGSGASEPRVGLLLG